MASARRPRGFFSNPPTRSVQAQGVATIRALVIRGRKVDLLLDPRRSRRLLLHTDLRDRAVATKAKAKVNHSRVGDTSRLLASQGREFVSIVTSLDTLDEIALKGRAPRVMGHHSPNHHWDMHRPSLFLPTPTWARGNDVSPRVLHKHLLFRRRTIWARVWVEVEVEDRALKLRLQGPRGMSTL